MNDGRLCLGLAAALALAGCDLFGTAPDASGNVAANQAGNVSDAGVTRSQSLAGLRGGAAGSKDPAVSAGAVPASAGASIEAGLLIGRWSDTGDCKTSFEFRPDGTFTTSDGGEGSWTLEGETLVLAGGNGSAELRITALDAAAMVAVDGDGRIGRSARC
jgi:hypothetical protein